MRQFIKRIARQHNYKLYSYTMESGAVHHQVDDVAMVLADKKLGTIDRYDVVEAIKAILG